MARGRAAVPQLLGIGSAVVMLSLIPCFPGLTPAFHRPGTSDNPAMISIHRDGPAMTAESSALSAPLRATLSANRTAIDAGQSVGFNLSASGGNLPYSVNFSGLPTNCTPPGFGLFDCAYDQPGVFPVVALVTDNSSGNATTASVAITVNPDISNVTFYTAGLPASSLGLVFQIEWGGGTAPFHFYFDFGDGSSWTSNYSSTAHVYGSAGNLQATVAVIDATRMNRSAAASFYLAPPPEPLTASVSASTAAPEVGGNLSINAAVSGGYPFYSYTWSNLPGGCVNANAATITCVPTGAGVSVIEVAIRDSVADATNAFMTVNVAPRLNASINASGFGGCGSPLEWVFTAPTAGGWPQYEYTWSFSDGQSGSASTDPTVEHVFGEPVRGPYAYANLTVTDAAGAASHSSYLASLASSCPAQPAPASSLAVPEGIAIAAVGLIAAAAIVWVGRRKRA